MKSVADALYWYQLWLRCLLTGEPTVEQYHAQVSASVMKAMGLRQHSTLYAIVDGQLTQVYPVRQAPTQAPQKKKKPTLTLVSTRDE